MLVGDCVSAIFLVRSRIRGCNVYRLLEKNNVNHLDDLENNEKTCSVFVEGINSR